MQKTTDATISRVDVTALTVIGEKQRVAGEQSKDIATKLMAAILAGNVEIATQCLDAIENACDAHKGSKGVNFAFTYAAIAQCRESVFTLTAIADAIGSEAWAREYDILADRLVRLAQFMPSTISNGGSDKNIPLTDMMRGMKSVTRAVGRTELAWIPQGKASDTLTAARKAEAERQARREKQAQPKAQAQALPQPQPATAVPGKARATRKAGTASK